MSDLEVPVPDQDYTGSRYETIRTSFKPPRPPIVFSIGERDYNCEYDLEADQEYIYTICNDDGSYITMGEERVFSDEIFMFYEINGQYDPKNMHRFSKEDLDIEGKENYNINSCNGLKCVKKDSKKKVLDKALSIAIRNNFKGAGGSLRRNITVSNHTGENAFQSRGTPGHVTFFWHIWNHFAPTNYKHQDPPNSFNTPIREPYPPHHSGGPKKIYIKMPIYHHTDGRFICNILLRRNFKPGNIIYSVLFEFTNLIHWSIFYSHCDRDINVYQVSQFHITINPFLGVQKTRIFFEYTPYINGEVHYEQRVMGVVSQLMIRAMYQLVSGRSLSTGFIMDADFMGLRSVIDEAGFYFHAENELTNISRQHIDLVETIQYVLGSSDFGLIDIIYYIRTLSAPAGGAAARLAGGKNINKYLTNINNIKERLKLLKKNKVKNKVKITKLSKLIEELKAKLKKQKEKDKAKLKKQKEKEKAKLKKQKEKEKAKLKKQKEKDNVKRKKTKAKKS